MNLFGVFLVDQGLATPGLIVEALDRQRIIKRPIAAIAREQQVLDMEQIFQILNRQIASGKKFGETAISYGYLTEDDVDRFLSIQKGEVPHLGEILVDMGVIGPETLEKALNMFLNERE